MSNEPGIDIKNMEAEWLAADREHGRQTFSLGSGRLVAIRNRPNIRRSFDATRFLATNEQMEFQLLFGADAKFGGRAFDNDIRDDRLIWGSYLTFKPGADSVLPGKGGLDVYWLGYRNADAVFDSISGDEIRQSFGGRAFGLFGDCNAWDYNIESLFQVGSIGDQNIAAWTIASVIGRTFQESPMKPRLGMNFDVISGDRSRTDKTLSTFNAYFPNNSYSSEAAIFAPANLIDLNLNADLNLSERVSIVFLCDFLWKYSVTDGVYVPPGVTAIEGSTSDARYIGNTLSVASRWSRGNSFETTLAAVYFDAGSVVRNAGGLDSEFLLLSATWAF